MGSVPNSCRMQSCRPRHRRRLECQFRRLGARHKLTGVGRDRLVNVDPVAGGSEGERHCDRATEQDRTASGQVGKPPWRDGRGNVEERVDARHENSIASNPAGLCRCVSFKTRIVKLTLKNLQNAVVSIPSTQSRSAVRAYQCYRVSIGPNQ